MGLAAQLPDLTAVLDVRVEVGAKYSAAFAPLEHPDTLVQALTAGLGALRQGLPADPRALLNPLEEAIQSLARQLPAAGFPEIAAFEAGLGQSQAVLQPLRDALASGGGLEDIKTLVLAKAGDPGEAVKRVLEYFKTLVPEESLEVLQTFAGTLQAFESDLPADPAAVAEFLAQSFLGVPLDLLAEPLGVANRFYAKAEGLADAAKVDALAQKIQAATDQMTAAAGLIRGLDPNAPDGYQAAAAALLGAKSKLGAVAALTEELAAEFQANLANLDGRALVAGLQSKLEGLPEIRPAQVDAFAGLVLDPIRRLNRQLDALTPEQLAQAFAEGGSAVQSYIDAEGFGEIRAALVKPLKDVGAAIAGLHLEELRTTLANAFDGLGGAVGAVTGAIQSVKAAIAEVLDSITGALAAITRAGGEVIALVGNAIQAVEDGLNAIPFGELKTEAQAAIGQLEGLLADFRPKLDGAMQAVNALREQLEKISLRDAAEPAFELMRSIQEQLGSLNLSLSAGGEAAALRVSLNVLAQIDLGPVRQSLTGAFDEIDPARLVDGISQSFQDLQGKLDEFHPSALLKPLEAPFAEMRDALEAANPAKLLDPVIGGLQTAGQDLAGLDLSGAIKPLAQPLAEIRAALDDLAPTKLLAPLSALFGELKQLFALLDITPLLDELTAQFADWLGRGLAGIQAAGDSVGKAGGLKSYLDGIGGGADDPEFGFLPGDVLKPVEVVFDKIMGLLDQVPEDRLLAAFQHLQGQFAGAVDAISPAMLPAQLDRRLRAGLAGFDFANNFALVSGLCDAYGEVALAFDALDEARVSAAARGSHVELAGLVAGANPEFALAPLRPKLLKLNQAASNFNASFDASGLAPAFGVVGEKVGGLLPPFLAGDLSVGLIKAELQALDPGRLRAEVNQEFEQALVKIGRFSGVLVAELPKLVKTFTAGTTAFLPGLLKEAFNEVYQPLLAQLDALNPEAILADLEAAAYQPVRAALAGLDPESILQELALTQKLQDFARQLEGVVGSLRQLQATVSAQWAQILSLADTFDPAQLGKPLDGAFANIDKALDDINIAGLLDALRRAVARLRGDLEKTLDEAEAALQAMLGAVPA